MRQLTKAEMNLLVYLESRAVDYGGTVDTSRMDVDEEALAAKWHDEGFIWYGVKQSGDRKRGFNHWVVLTYAAWEMAHADRKRRARENIIRDTAMSVEALEAGTGGE